MLEMNNLKMKLKKKTTIPCIVVSKKNKIFKNKFNKVVSDLYTENYKTLLKRIFKNPNK